MIGVVRIFGPLESDWTRTALRYLRPASESSRTTAGGSKEQRVKEPEQ